MQPTVVSLPARGIFVHRILCLQESGPDVQAFACQFSTVFLRGGALKAHAVA